MHLANTDIDFSTRTHIMGIINCTSDSFYANSRRQTVDDITQTAASMVAEGADFLDIGGESSRPGSDPVSLGEEIERVVPAVEAVVREVNVPVSVDTYKSDVAVECLRAGATLVNDISALRFDNRMAEVIARNNAAVVLMHMQGKPKDMQLAPTYRNVVTEILEHLAERARVAESAGIASDKIILDPGVGFGKGLDDNYLILNHLKRFCALGFPVLVGLSRKSFIQRVLNLPAEESLEGTIAMNTAAILNGAQILRVHDVQAAKRTATIVDSFMQTAKGMNND